MNNDRNPRKIEITKVFTSNNKAGADINLDPFAMSLNKNKKEINIPIVVSDKFEHCSDSEIPIKAGTNREFSSNKDIGKKKKVLDSFKNDLEERDKVIEIPISFAGDKNSNVRFGDRIKRYVLT